MMQKIKGMFHLSTDRTSYLFSVSKYGHLINHHYGKRIEVQESYAPVIAQSVMGLGTSVNYNRHDKNYILDNECLEVSSPGKGDYREPMIVLKNTDGSFVNDFRYESDEIKEGDISIDGLPSAYGGSQTLCVTLKDKEAKVTVKLFYTVFDSCDILARHTEIVNDGESEIEVQRAMSLQLDLCESNFELVTFDGAWAKERHKHVKTLSEGILINDSKTGFSSNRHNPFVILKKPHTTEEFGDCYGFNLLYSGNHCETAEVTPYQKLRFLTGISPFLFSWTLKPKESFQTPQAVMSYSGGGLNALSQNFHNFVRAHIVRGEWKDKVRPVLVNSWEAFYFSFNEKKLLKLGEVAAKVGVELFVLDDGWFGKRDNDECSLGDWTENRSKLPDGLKGLSQKLKKMGLSFGIWVEPEMVNEDSNLYRTHPEYAVKEVKREPSLARNQLILNLGNKEVENYLYDALSKIFHSAEIQYCKWDMNRNFSDMFDSSLKNQGEFFHRYMLGLYSLLSRITQKFPNILFEGCASGGNRFDMGMLCYFPQIWTSDDTDAFERVFIQEGTSYGYPLSVMGAHVSACPNHQTLRHTQLESRFNIAFFGILGYEMDLTKLSAADGKTISAQIEFYKTHRETLLTGDFYRHTDVFSEDYGVWQVISKDKKTSICGVFNKLATLTPKTFVLKQKSLLSEKIYHFSARRQNFDIRAFGELINHALPIKIKQDGLIHNLIADNISLKSEKQECEGTGGLFENAGIKLSQEFCGTGYDENARIMLDFGSRLYVLKAIENEK